MAEVKVKKTRVRKRNNGISEDSWALIRTAWAYDWPDTKVVKFAGTTMNRLQRSYEKDPLLREERDILRQNPLLNCKRNIALAIADGDINTTKWYLERRDRDFSIKSQVDVNVNHTLTMPEIVNKLAKYIDPSRLPGPDEQVIDVEPTDCTPPTKLQVSMTPVALR